VTRESLIPKPRESATENTPLEPEPQGEGEESAQSDVSRTTSDPSKVEIVG